jgi:hypothetical protein
VGGYNSGWHRATTNTVEDGLILSSSKLQRDRMMRPNLHWAGTVTWSHSYTGEKLASIGLDTHTTDGAGWARLHYTRTNAGEQMDYRVNLTTTPLPWGGLRWWFLCPLVTGGRYCGRRVGKLCLPPGARYFGCRHCYRLAYTSSREAHKFESVLGLVGRDFNLTGREVAKLLGRKRAWGGS